MSALVGKVPSSRIESSMASMVSGDILEINRRAGPKLVYWLKERAIFARLQKALDLYSAENFLCLWQTVDLFSAISQNNLVSTKKLRSFERLHPVKLLRF